MRRFMYGTHVLLHISVFLFFWAIGDFFYTVDHLFGVVARYALVAASIVYVLLSISPLISNNSPYNTPITLLLRVGWIILHIINRFPSWFPSWYRREPFDLTGLKYYQGIHFDRAQFYSMEAGKRAENIEPYAMKWLFTDDDFSDDDMDKFLEGLPGYMSSSHTKKGQLDQYLTADPILSRIKEHFITCATSVGLSDEARIERVSSCVKALLRIFQYSREYKQKAVESSPELAPDKLKRELELQRKYTQELINHFKSLSDMVDQEIALRASCIGALAVQGLLSQLAQDNRKTDKSQFPISLIPIYEFSLPPNDNTDTMRQPDGGHRSKPEEMWDSLLQDGPLTNLTTLAQAIRDREDAPPSNLSFCWKTLDKLLKQLGTIRFKGSTHAQDRFDKLHEDIRTYVRDDERGFRVTPLLEILDIVARGQRLLTLFSGYPKYQAKYHNRPDVVFGKEYLQNSDLLEAFADCLPHFISNNSLDNSPEVSRDLMEKVVRDDNLWTSLQVNLWNIQRSDRPTPDKHRVFEDCCTVVYLAFLIPEDSREVDRRAPEFESLAQNWWPFIEHCFRVQVTFMGKATNFRVGVIKARFCNALLARFSNDIKEGTVSFRSQWDVASLARLIRTLGLWDKENLEFWNSYVNGGHIGAEFTTKALEMIDIIARDGPLLIFCLLGHLTVSAVPLDQSGLEFEDIEKVRKLQVKVIDKERLHLNRPSDKVWGEVGQMRKQVHDLLGKNAGKDIKILQDLLQLIDDVYNLRFSGSGSEGPSQSNPAEEQGCKASDAKILTSSSESRGITNRCSFDSESTSVSGGGPPSGTPTGEREVGFGRACSLLFPGAFIDFQPENPAVKVLDRERETYVPVRAESLQSDESGSRGLPSHATVQRTPGVRIMGRSTVTSISAIHLPVLGDARQHGFTRQTDSGYSGTLGLSLVTPASTSVLSTSRIIRPNHAIGSSYEPFEFSNEDQSSTESSSLLSHP
jgi:hypothetical protein